MNKQLYIMIGDNPRDWCERTPLGPYASENKARAAIREDIADKLDGCEMLSTGKLREWCERYTIVEQVKSFKPCLTVTAQISLPNAESIHPESKPNDHD